MPQPLLNYSSLYSTVSPFINSVAGSTDWLRIFISPDVAGSGHFITHGIDFGASYANGLRGLVPGNSGVLNKTFLRGDGWSALWTAAAEAAAAVGETDAQKLAAKEAYLQSTLASVYDIKQWIQQSFIANDAMRFKGKITIDGTGVISTVTESGTTNGFPINCEVGDTYKVDGNTIDSNSHIAGEPVSTGDLVVCIKAGSGNSLNSAQYWTVVQDNVEHLITYTFNGTAYKLYAQTPNNITLFAPITAGTTGQILISKGSGNAPEWTNPANITVGEAGKTTYSLTKGNGIRLTQQGVDVNAYDGSVNTAILLAVATASNIGGVIIDNGTNSEKYNAAANTGHTPYPTITVDSNGLIYLTKDNIVNALGYDPISALPIFTDSTDGIVPMSSAANKSNTPAIETTYLLGADAKWYKLPTSAFQSDRRIIKSNGTTIISAASGNALDIIAGSHINLTPGQTSGDYNGALTFDVIWRDVQIRTISGSTISQNVQSIGNNDPLVFDNTDTVFLLGEEVTVGSGTNTTTKTVVKAHITWYNLDTGEYEMI